MRERRPAGRSRIWLGMMLLLAGAGASAGARTITLKAEKQAVGRYERIELMLGGIGEYANPFDPGEVDVTVEFRTPRGARVVLPAFWHQPYERQERPLGGRPAAWLYPVGRPSWKARYAPAEVGVYTAVARLRDREDVVTSKPVTFRCVPSRRKGFLRVSRQDPRFLAFDDGSSFFAIGQNVAFVKELDETEGIMRRMAAQGANFARIWTCCEDWGMAIEARKSAWGRSWDWKPPIVPLPGREGDPGAPKCVRVQGVEGAAVPVQPSHPVALRAGMRYIVAGTARTDDDAALAVEVFGRPLGEPMRGMGDWTSFRREFTAPENGWWLEGMSLRTRGGGAAWVRDLTLREAAGGPDLLWEADVNQPILGRYNPTDCEILDRVVEAGEASGVYLQLCLLTRDLYMDRLKSESAPEYARAIADARNLLRYAVARWGWSTHVAAWEYWNEMDPGRPTGRFYAEMGRYLERTDPYRHLRDTSAWADAPGDWRHPQLDVANMHWYMRPAGGESFKDEVAGVLERARALRRAVPDRPALFAEFGLARDDWQPSPYMEQDAGYVHLHNALWASALSGLSGTVLPWWWEDIERRGAYRHYRGVADFMADVPLTTARLRDANSVAADPRWRVVGLKGADRAYLWVSDGRATWWRQVVEKTPPAESRGVVVTVAGLAPGAYRVRWHRTTDGAVVASQALEATGGALRMVVPPFTGDIACKATRRQP